MANVSITVIALCVLHCVTGLLTNDPLDDTFIRTKAALNNINYKVSTAMSKASTQISSVKSELKPQLSKLQNEIQIVDDECALELKPQMSPIWNQFGVLERCRKSQEFNAIRNNYIAVLKQEMNLVQYYKRACTAKEDYYKCAAREAAEIDASVEIIVQTASTEFDQKEQETNICIEESSNTIATAINDLAVNLQSCRT